MTPCVPQENLAREVGRARYEQTKPAPGESLVLFLGELYLGVDQLLRLVALLCVCPSEVLGSRPILRRFYWYEWLCKIPLAAAWKFVTLPLLSPEEHARRIYMPADAKGKRRQEARPPPPPKMIRVKWYPDLEAPLKPWPTGLGELWADLPTNADGSLDLRPLKRIWGMENIFVIDASCGRRLRTGRKPDEQLSALAWNVLLEGHSVLGVIEKAAPSTQVAREGRAFVKRLATDPSLWWSLIRALPTTASWTALALLAIPILTVWRIVEPVSKTVSSLVATAAHATWTRVAMHISLAAHSVRRRLIAKCSDFKQLVLSLCSKARGAGHHFVEAVASVFSILGSILSKCVSPLLAWLVFAICICAMVLADGLYQLVVPASQESAEDEAEPRDIAAQDGDYLATGASDDYSYGSNGEDEYPEEWDSEGAGDDSYSHHEEYD